MKKLVFLSLSIFLASQQAHAMFNIFKNPDLEAQVAAQNNYIKRLESDLKTSSSNLQGIKKRLERKEEDLKKANDELQQFLNNEKASKKELENLNKRLEDGEENISKLTEEKATAETQLATITSELETKQQEINKLEAEKLALEKSMKQMSANLEKAKKEGEDLSKEKSELREKNNLQNEENRQLKEQVAQLKFYKDFLFAKFIKHLELPGENDALWVKEDGKLNYILKNDVLEDYFNLQSIKNKNCSVKFVKCFIPKSCNNYSEKVVISMVHGTFVHADDYLPFKENESPGKTYEALAQYAENKASELEKPVIFWVFDWEGYNSQEARSNGGKSYAKIHNRFFSMPDWYDIHIAHSHGGNVLTYASGKFLKEAEKFYLLATPPREGEDIKFEPRNIKEIILFWTDRDLIQVLGSLKVDTWWAFVKSIFDQNSSRKFKIDKELVVRNIRVLIDGVGCGHSSIKNVLSLMTNIEKKIVNNFPYHADLQLNLSTNEQDQASLNKNLLMAVRGAKQYIWKTDAQQADVSKKIVQSLNISNKVKEKFKSHYGYEMDVKSGYMAELLFGLLTNNNKPVQGWNNQKDPFENQNEEKLGEDMNNLLDSQIGFEINEMVLDEFQPGVILNKSEISNIDELQVKCQELLKESFVFLPE